MVEAWAEQILPDNVFLGIVMIKCAIVGGFLGVMSLIAMISIWWERKVAGHIQSRTGPMHVGPHGLLQSLADGIKLILKEDLVPAKADSMLFRLAPYLAFAPVFAAYAVLPFGPQFTFESGLYIGVLYLLAMLAVEVMSTIIAGWSSNSKWSVYGAMREACQMVSYEIPLGISIIAGVIVAGTLNMVELGYLQGEGMHKWFLFHNPFMFLIFIIYFVASLASSKRAPFDLPESESELVSGYHTEYSGLRWSLFFFAEYGGMFVIGGIQAALFLGAWNSPLGSIDPVYNALGYDPVVAGQAFATGQLGGSAESIASNLEMNPISLFLLNVYAATWFTIKCMATIFLQIWIRWTLPRIRIDQVLHTCVKVLLPGSLIGLLGAMAWIGLFPSASFAEGQGEGLRSFWAHLLGETSNAQLVVSGILMAIAFLFVLPFIYWAASGWIKVLFNRGNPPKSLFSDVMPVSSDIAFTKGKDAEEATA